MTTEQEQEIRNWADGDGTFPPSIMGHREIVRELLAAISDLRNALAASVAEVSAKHYECEKKLKEAEELLKVEHSNAVAFEEAAGDAEERARVAEANLARVVGQFDILREKHNAQNERANLSVAEAGALRQIIEHCHAAVISPNGPLYGVDSWLIDKIEDALATPGPSRRILAVVEAARAVDKSLGVNRTSADIALHDALAKMNCGGSDV